MIRTLTGTKVPGSGRRCVSAAALACLFVSAGCSGAPEWRELQPGAAGLRASLPCRPNKQVRAVPLAGHVTTLTLYVCRSAGLTFAFSHADVTDPARVGPALRALRQATQANLVAPPGRALAGWRVAGATPQPEAGRWLLRGHLPDGRPQQAEVAVFSRGTHVVQATVMGEAPDAALVQGFFDALRFADAGAPQATPGAAVL